jgi:hypothetical protein
LERVDSNSKLVLANYLLEKNPTQWGGIFLFFTKKSGQNLRKKRVKNIEASKTSKKRNTILTDIKLYPKFKGDINADIA